MNEGITIKGKKISSKYTKPIKLKYRGLTEYFFLKWMNDRFCSGLSSAFIYFIFDFFFSLLQVLCFQGFTGNRHDNSSE